MVLGVDLEGQKAVPALWVAQTEGTNFWLQVLAELHNGGVKLLHTLWGERRSFKAHYTTAVVWRCQLPPQKYLLRHEVAWRTMQSEAAEPQAEFQ
jgi:putative transposase